MSDTLEIYTQILALDGDRFMLPAVAVGEVLNLEGMRLSTGPPNWLLGSKRWAGQTLAIVSLEGLCGRPVPTRSARSRIVVLRLPDGRSLGVICQGQPHLAPINATALRAVELSAIDPPDIVLARMRIANILVMVPDLETMMARVEKAQLVQQSHNAPAWQPGQTL